MSALPDDFGSGPSEECLKSRQSQLVKLLISRGYSPEVAEDAAQEAVLAGQAAIKSGEANTIVDRWQWLINKAKNAARTIVNQRKSRKAEPTRLRPGQFSETVNEAPCERIDSDEYKAKVRALLHLLPKREREAMELYLQGASYLEVAEALGVSPPTACAYRTRAIDRLKFYFPAD